MRLSNDIDLGEVCIRCANRSLPAFLAIPTGASGVIAFAHGSGSGRLSSRNQFVAEFLQRANLATLLLDLLDENEAEDRENTFNIDLLASRVQVAVDWLGRDPRTQALRVGLFGASTGAAAALVAAAKAPERVGAVVSRGGRPDLAGQFLGQVQAPTLLIVGGNDDVVRQLNEVALAKLRCPKQMTVIAGATHLFPEAGTLEQVAEQARIWFGRHLVPPELRSEKAE